MSSHKTLANYQSLLERINNNWSGFQSKRADRLMQEKLNGPAAEAVAERIIEDLFTDVLDWKISDLNHQVGRADISLSKLGIKRLIIEAKRPRKLTWNQSAVKKAMVQARSYADQQKVRQIAVSDGLVIYAADIENGVLKYRLIERLDSPTPPESLWWISKQGLDQRPDGEDVRPISTLPTNKESPESPVHDTDPGLLHPKYKIPAACFAYVGDSNNTSTWKLPHRLIDGSPDARRIGGAIQSIVNNFRGVNVLIPPECVPDVLKCLAVTAIELGKMPFQQGSQANTNRLFEDALNQIGYLDELKKHQ